MDLCFEDLNFLLGSVARSGSWIDVNVVHSSSNFVSSIGCCFTNRYEKVVPFGKGNHFVIIFRSSFVSHIAWYGVPKDDPPVSHSLIGAEHLLPSCTLVSAHAS